MKRILLAYTLSALCLLPAFAGGGEGALPISYVNPFIGTTNFGTTNPGAVCPNGMMSVVPFNVMGRKIISMIKMPVGGLLLTSITIAFLPDIRMSI